MALLATIRALEEGKPIVPETPPGSGVAKKATSKTKKAESAERGYTAGEMLDLQMAVADGRDELLAPKEVAAMCKIDPKTVVRKAKEGALRTIRLNSGHRRYSRNEVLINILGMNPAEVARVTRTKKK